MPHPWSGWTADTIWSARRRLERARGQFWPAGRAATAGRTAPIFRISGGTSADGPALVALTFDDGPDPRWTPCLLDVLARHQVHATFFLVGERAREYPRIAERIALAGHAVGNHSMSHPPALAALPPDRIRQEILRAQDAILDATGQAPRFFRAPCGNWSGTVLRLARAAGLQPVDWGIDSRDWRKSRIHHITGAILRGGPGDVILCHDGGGDRSATVRAVDAALPLLRARGLACTTL